MAGKEPVRQVPDPLRQGPRPLSRRRRRRGHVHHPVRPGGHQEEGQGRRHGPRRAREGRLLRRDGHPRARAALGHGRGGRGGRPHRHQRRDVRGHDQGQPRDRRAHAAQAVHPPARDEQAAREGDGRAAAACPGTAAAAEAAPAAAPRPRAPCRPRRGATSSRRRTGNVFPVLHQRRAHRPLRLRDRDAARRSTSPRKTRAATSPGATRAS